ncbi:HD domain-containing protein [Candidatus Gracilibacteria bacterium]|nr:HD domain-containing protein [Candidatus Gracilibacteria bacterium]NUJ98332.1 HD domain-containing protein [Candidatus Gracilibacteria bacterium]NUJ99313.1 HD domain-containing protein [Candidatus Gracilibacteria bacterium]
MQDGEKIFDFILFLEKLSINKRWTKTDSFLIKESISDHSFRVLLIVFVMYRKLKPNIDLLKTLKIALVHDIIEGVVGDTDYNSVYLGLVSKEEKAEKELEAIQKIRESLPEKIGNEIFFLWMDYEKAITKEAKFVKALEKTESILHTIYYGDSYINIVDKFATYCDNAMKECSELHPYYAEVKRKLKEVCQSGGLDWKDSYDMEETMEDFEKIFTFFQLAQKLKETERYGASPEVKEKSTVAEHTFRLVFIVFLVKEFFEVDIDLLKAFNIAIFHDIAETLTEEIDCVLIYKGIVSKEEKSKNELVAMQKIREMLPHEIGDEIFSLWEEYEKGETKEAQIVKAFDKFEGISHLLYYGYENFDEPDIIATHCDTHFKKVPELLPLLKILKTRLKEEYKKWGKDWKREYDEVFL